MQKPINKIVAAFRDFTKFLLIIHSFPDGDTIASSLALYLVLKDLGKEVEIVCRDDIPVPFQFLSNVAKIKKDFLSGDYDVIVLLDCGDLGRTGFEERIKTFARQKKRLINIDHHPRNNLHKIANINLFDCEKSSTGEILFEIFNLLEVKIDKDIATCLLTSLYTDTGGFMHTNVTSKTLEISSLLMSRGAQLKKITKNISNIKSVPSLRLWGVALSRMKHHSFGFVYSFITKNDLVICGANSDSISGIINLMNSTSKAKAAILFYEMDDNKIKASLRSESETDVSKLAAVFGGGGHKKASGFMINGKIVESTYGWKIQTD